jgi:hypothetical protein
MPSSLVSSERSGSVKLGHSPKTSLQSKADPNMALYEQEPSKSPLKKVRMITSWIICLHRLAAVNLEPGARDLFSLRNMQHKDREGKLISTYPPFSTL